MPDWPPRGRSGGIEPQPRLDADQGCVEITLLDVYNAVGDGEIFGMHASPPDAECYVGYGIQPVLTRVYERATTALCDSLATATIADILRDTMAEFETGSGAQITRGR